MSSYDDQVYEKVYEAAKKRAAERNAKLRAIPLSATDQLLNGIARGTEINRLDQQANAQRIYDAALSKHNTALLQVRVTKSEVERAAKVLGLEVPSSEGWLEA